MSGSYDRPTGRRDQGGAQAATDFDLYDTVLTGPATGQRYTYEPTTGSLDDTPARKFAHSRGRKLKTEPTSTPVVPPDSVTGRSLTLVISIMCFLACLTAGAVYMINQSANAWLKDIASEVTAQIEPRDGMDVDKTVRDAEAFLRNQKGIARANALSLATSSKLLEPWLGQSDVLAALPVPRLIAIEIDRDNPPNIEQLRAGLTKQFPSASLDDHRRWQQQIRTVTRSFALGGLAMYLISHVAHH